MGYEFKLDYDTVFPTLALLCHISTALEWTPILNDLKEKIFSLTCLHLSVLGSRLPGKLTILPRYSSHSVTNRDFYVEITSIRPCLARSPDHNFDKRCTWIQLKKQGTGDSSLGEEEAKKLRHLPLYIMFQNCLFNQLAKPSDKKLRMTRFFNMLNLEIINVGIVIHTWT